MNLSKSRLLDVGNCDPDHGMIRRMLTQNFAVEIDRVMFVNEAIEMMRQNRYDLVLVNRLIFADNSEGIELLHQSKADSGLSEAPIMMISNYKEAQDRSIASGGVAGFGKNSIFDSSTIQLLERFLLPLKPASGNTPISRSK